MYGPIPGLRPVWTGGPEEAVQGTVAATATLVPVHLAAKVPLAWGRAEFLIGPCLEASYLRIASASAVTPVRSMRNIMFGAGAEAEARVTVIAGVWLFVRAAALGILNGEAYEVSGWPIFDTSRLQLAGTIGVGIGLR